MYMYVIMCKPAYGGQELTLGVFYYHYLPSELVFHLNSELTALLDWLSKEFWRPTSLHDDSYCRKQITPELLLKMPKK